MLQQPAALMLKRLFREGQVGHHGIAVEVMAAPMFLGNPVLQRGTHHDSLWVLLTALWVSRITVVWHMAGFTSHIAMCLSHCRALPQQQDRVIPGSSATAGATRRGSSSTPVRAVEVAGH